MVDSNMGLSVKKIGKLVLSDSDTLISVILQLPDIQQDLNEFTTSEYSRIKECLREGTQAINIAHPIEVATRDLFNQTEEYLRSRREILKPYIIDISKSNRNKRSILAALGGSLLTLAFGGVAEYQMYQLRSHIENNSDKIKQLQDDLVTEQNNRLKLRQDIIGLIKADRESLKNYINFVSCRNIPIMLTNREKDNFWRRVKIIDEVLSGPLEGKKNLVLNPRIIDPEILQKVVDQHPQLNGTTFKNNPHLLYSTSTISLFSVNKNLTQAHFIIYIPIVRVENNLHDVYET